MSSIIREAASAARNEYYKYCRKRLIRDNRRWISDDLCSADYLDTRDGILVCSSDRVLDANWQFLEQYAGKNGITGICSISDIRQEADCFYVLWEMSIYPQLAQRMRKTGMREGLDFILALDAAKYRRDNQYGRQKSWRDVEKKRRTTKYIWVERIEIMRSLISRESSSVLDLGCWESELRDYLSSGVRYYGCDYVRRDEDTIVCDLNAYEFPDVAFDTAYISGSLEYMENLEWYFDHICRAGREIIMSYSSLEHYPFIQWRQDKSWVNHLSISELRDEMNKRGFRLTDSAFWGRWTSILKFEK